MSILLDCPRTAQQRATAPKRERAGQLFDEIADAGVNIHLIPADVETYEDNYRGCWRASGGVMLERLSARLSSVAAPAPSSQSKDVAAGRALNTKDNEWVGAAAELAEFVNVLQGDKLDEVLAMLGEPETFELMAFITLHSRSSNATLSPSRRSPQPHIAPRHSHRQCALVYMAPSSTGVGKTCGLLKYIASDCAQSTT